MEVALVAARLVQFAAAMLLLGSPVFALALATRLSPASPVRRAFERWLRQMLLLAAAAAVLSAVLWLDLEAAIMGDGWDRALDPDTIAVVLSATTFGHAWTWHLGFAAALLGIALVSPPRPPRALSVLVALLAAAHVISLAWAGHAVMHPGIAPVLVQALHLLAAALWLGSLPALFRLLTLVQRDGGAESLAALRYMLPLYSRAGYGAVGIVLLTGMLNTWFIAGSAEVIATTTFGRVLLVKIGLVLLMVAIAVANRTRLLPSIAAPQPTATSAAHVRALSRSVALEQAVGGLVLAAVSLLGTLPPGLQP